MIHTRTPDAISTAERTGVLANDRAITHFNLFGGFNRRYSVRLRDAVRWIYMKIRSKVVGFLLRKYKYVENLRSHNVRTSKQIHRILDLGKPGVCTINAHVWRSI